MMRTIGKNGWCLPFALSLLFCFPLLAQEIIGIKKTMPSNVGATSSIVWHPGNGKIYISTNSGYLLELNAEDLSLLKQIELGEGRAHELTSDGTHLYIQSDNSGGSLTKVLATKTDLKIISKTPVKIGSGWSEGSVFLNGSIYSSWSGGNGLITNIDPNNMNLEGTWKMGYPNHGLTTDGENLYVLGAKTSKGSGYYYKVSPSLKPLDTLKFPWEGALGGSIFVPSTGSIYSGFGKVSRIDPKTLKIIANSVYSTTSKNPLHWLATDNHWVYAIDYSGNIRVFDPLTLEIVYTKNTGINLHHYGIVQNGYLWVVGETSPGVVGRYTLYPPKATSIDEEKSVFILKKEKTPIINAFPNPFNSATTISFTSLGNNTSLHFYDLIGNLVWQADKGYNGQPHRAMSLQPPTGIRFGQFRNDVNLSLCFLYIQFLG